MSFYNILIQTTLQASPLCIVFKYIIIQLYGIHIYEYVTIYYYSAQYFLLNPGSCKIVETVHPDPDP
jgi:hypothetical protein